MKRWTRPKPAVSDRRTLFPTSWITSLFLSLTEKWWNRLCNLDNPYTAVQTPSHPVTSWFLCSSVYPWALGTDNSIQSWQITSFEFTLQNPFFNKNKTLLLSLTAFHADTVSLWEKYCCFCMETHTWSNAFQRLSGKPSEQACCGAAPLGIWHLIC